MLGNIVCIRGHVMTLMTLELAEAAEEKELPHVFDVAMVVEDAARNFKEHAHRGSVRSGGS